MTTIHAAVLEAIATHLRKFGFSQPAMIADKIDAILRDHAARERNVRDIGGNTKVCDKCMRLHKPDQTECFADTDAMNKKALGITENNTATQAELTNQVARAKLGIAVTTSTPDISEAYKRSTAEPVDDLRPYETNPNWPATPTQSGECAGVCECGHDRDAHNGEFGCLETNGAILICNCKYYRDRARGGR